MAAKDKEVSLVAESLLASILMLPKAMFFPSDGGFAALLQRLIERLSILLSVNSAYITVEAMDPKALVIEVEERYRIVFETGFTPIGEGFAKVTNITAL